VVFHLAAYGVAPEDRDAQATFDVNLRATHSIIQTVAAGGCRAFLYAGSCSEYRAAPHGSRLTEEHPLSCLSTYGASKAAAGLWGSALAKSLAIPFQWMRLFGVFGPGEASYRLVPYLIQRLRRGASVDLTPGEQWRDFLYIHDAVRGLRAGADAALRGVLGPFNLCSGRPVTVRTVAGMVADRLGANPDLLGFGKRNYRPEEAMWMVGDATAFARATGFEPLVPLEEGIARMVAYEPNH